MYQRVGSAAYKKDLSNTLKLVSYLEEPQQNFKSIHVAGTNGKGSTSHMLASVLQEAGYKTGLYTSPHLKDFRERIKINGEFIPKSTVTTFVTRHKRFFEENHLSFFEMTVGMAFDHFKKENIDVAIIEVGLGGRLDSTNIIFPEVSVITNIGMDHTRFLGNSLLQIASEKAGIIKPNTPVVIGESQKGIKEIFVNTAHKINSPIFFADESENTNYELDLKGHYQKKNSSTAVLTIRKMVEKGFIVPETAIEKGLKKVVSNTGILGRWQELQHSPRVICDMAHNREGLKTVIGHLESLQYDRLHMVIGLVNDKELEDILPLLPKTASYYFCKPDVERGLDVEIFQREGGKFGLKGSSYDSVQEAYKAALNEANMNDFIYVGGSTFVVAEVL